MVALARLVRAALPEVAVDVGFLEMTDPPAGPVLDRPAGLDHCSAEEARLLGEWVGSPFVHTAFTGVTGPSVTEGLEVFARLGYRRMALAFWFLCTGVLIERARAEVAAFSARRGVEVVDAGYLGPDPGLVPAIIERYEEAVRGLPVVNCDLCAYRAPWPGREDRHGQPIGVGHSHLAVDHRH